MKKLKFGLFEGSNVDFGSSEAYPKRTPDLNRTVTQELISKSLPGPMGATGAALTWDDLTQEQKDSLIGIGITDISLFSDGPAGQAGVTDQYRITLSDASTYDFYVYNGANGTNGDSGAKGDSGTDAIIITDIYIDGDDIVFEMSNASEYRILKPIDGTNGTNGTNGMSSYEVWLAEGNSGSEAVFLNSLNGNDGTDGDIFKSTSLTSIDMSTKVVGNTLTFTLVESGLAYIPNQNLVCTSGGYYIYGRVISYSGNTLQIYLEAKYTNAVLADWQINLSGGVVVSNEYYEITATAGINPNTRTYIGPIGWTIGDSNSIQAPGLGIESFDLTILHGTGLNVVDVIVFAIDGVGKETKLKHPLCYATLYGNALKTAIELASFCTQNLALRILVKLQ